MKNLYFAIMVFLIVSQTAFAQVAASAPYYGDTAVYRNKMDYYFYPLDKTRIPTGILYDRVFPVANLERYTGFNGQDTTSSDQFHQAYYELYSASYQNQTWKLPGQLADDLKRDYGSNNEHAIGIQYYDYNVFDTLALQNNQIRFQNNQFQDVPGRTADPYLPRTFFAAVPLLQPEETIAVGMHYFTLNPAYQLANRPLAIRQVQADFGDGQGWQTFDANAGCTSCRGGFFRFLGSFRFPGSFLIRLVVVLTDGTTLRSVSRLSVRDNEPKTEITGCNGGDQIAIQGIPFNASAYGMSSSLTASGRAYIFYSAANCASRRITRPIVFIDGFDPDNKRDAQKIYDQYVNREFRTVSGQTIRLGDKLRAEGFDLIVFDYQDGSGLIEANALAVLRLLQTLRATYQTSLQQDFVVIGPSMGALVAQYALAFADANNIPHHTRLYVSFDGPHQGANIPVGLQYFIDYMTQRGWVSNVFLKLRNGLHNGVAARQILAHHASANSETPTPDGFRNIFLNNLNAVGRYPTRSRNIAIINGNTAGVKNPFHTPCAEILNISVKRRGLFQVLGKKIDWSAFASAESGSCRSVDMKTYAPLANLFLWRGPSLVRNTLPAPNNNSLDVAPGSYFGELVKPGGTTEATINLSTAVFYLFTGRDAEIRQKLNNTTFMPTLSAMDYQSQSPNPNLYMDLSGRILARACSSETPFDYVYASSNSTEHVAINEQTARWFEDEVKGELPSGYSVTGPAQFCFSGNYSISPALPAGATATWSTNNTNVSITGGGIATRLNNYTGPVTVNAAVDWSCRGGTITKTVTINTGVSQLSGIYGYGTGSTYTLAPNKNVRATGITVTIAPAGLEGFTWQKLSNQPRLVLVIQRQYALVHPAPVWGCGLQGFGHHLVRQLDRGHLRLLQHLG